MSSDATTPKTDDTLKFDRADTAAPEAAAAPVACDQCQQPITLAYFEANGRVLCAKCRHIVEHAWNGGDSTRAGRLTRAMMFGLVGGLVGGAVWFAIAVLFNIELGLVAILVGFLVGQGVRKGASGRSGRRYQVLAVALTYLAISGSYAAMAVRSIGEEAAKERGADSVSTATTAPAAAATTPATTDPADEGTAGDSTLASAVAATATSDTVASTSRGVPADSAVQSVAAPIAVFFGVLFALALPILANVMDMPGGLIGIAIIFFALQQAWALNAAAPLVITGPHRLGTPRPPTPFGT